MNLSKIKSIFSLMDFSLKCDVYLNKKSKPSDYKLFMMHTTYETVRSNLMARLVSENKSTHNEHFRLLD